MRSSLRSGFAFAGGALLVFAAAYAVGEAVDPVNPSLRARLELLRERHDRIEAIAVGNSHGGRVDFAEMGLDGVHFTSGSQDAFEAVLLADHATSKARSVRYVMFAATYGMVWKDNAVVGSVDLRERRRRIYAVLPMLRPLPGDRSLWLSGVLSPVVRDDHWSGFVRRLIRRDPPAGHDRDGRTVERPSPPPTPDSLARYGARVGAADTRLGQEMVSLAPDAPQRVEAMLGALAGKLASRGATLVLFTPPYHESYLRPQDPALNLDARRVLERVIASHDNVFWFDYGADPRFAARAELFNNSDHLNVEGGRLFSRLLRECLDSALVATPEARPAAACPASPPDP